MPRNIRETGLTPEAITGLTLKTLYTQGARTGRELTESVRLPFHLLDTILLDLQHRQLVEVGGVRGHGRGGYVFDLTSAGRSRAQEEMETSQYVGPAPVPLDEYRFWVEQQSVLGATIEPGVMMGELGHLILPGDLLRQLGPAINSGRSMFLYGHAGNGKTEIATSIARMLKGKIFLPYAFEVEGRTIVVHDPTAHEREPMEEKEAGPEERDQGLWLTPIPDHDLRYAHIERPVVFTGGELTLEHLDLRYDPHAKFYRAPIQVKANGGVLVIDDLGRQIVRVDDLLNRWMVPLEKRVDYLTLHTGHSFRVPFDCLLVFSTNLEPSELVDEAFLRRINYKIHVENPTREAYERIFQRCCESRSIKFDGSRIDVIYRDYYDRRGIPPRACHPRDLVLHLCDMARFEHRAPTLTAEELDQACRTYFLDQA
ncbi:MAG TPA: ATP-binding protein [Gemmatimonadota bacterium]|nr:ATP-binding protein [Gemmatimonadota bacterium]